MLDDLAAEGDSLAAVLDAVDDWGRPTPAAGWTVRDQVAHLAEGDELALLAVRDADAFAARVSALLADLAGTTARMAARAAGMSGEGARAWWEATRTELAGALRSHPAGERIPWVTGPMSPTSFATARLMETFAHGVDVRDALGLPVPATERLRHVAHLGVATRAFSFRNRGLAVPDPEPRVELDGWTWGPPASTEVVRGPALDFCLLVTQRRHRSRLRLDAGGPGADAWLDIAQCFAGPPTDADPLR